MTVVALKLLLAPSFVVAASILTRRFGVRLGGVVAGLPAIAGPILLVLALDRGRAFAREAATGTLLGIVALVAFVVVYAAVSRRFAWQWALLAGWSAFLAGILALRPVDVGPVAALCLACAACGATLALLRCPDAGLVSPPRTPRGDLILRALAAVLPVIAVTGAASLLGPHFTGLVAAFPIITPVLAAFTHAQQGPTASTRLLHGMTAGFFAYALFCFTVAVGLRELGIAATFVLATAAALAAQLIAMAATRRREARGYPPSAAPID